MVQGKLRYHFLLLHNNGAIKFGWEKITDFLNLAERKIKVLMIRQFCLHVQLVKCISKFRSIN